MKLQTRPRVPGKLTMELTFVCVFLIKRNSAYVGFFSIDRNTTAHFKTLAYLYQCSVLDIGGTGVMSPQCCRRYRKKETKYVSRYSRISGTRYRPTLLQNKTNTFFFS